MNNSIQKALVIFFALVITLFAIVVNSKAQMMIPEGSVCAAFETSDSELVLVNLDTLDEVIVETNVFDFTVDPITGDLYLARMPQIGRFDIVLNDTVIFESDNRFFGFDAYNGQMIFTENVTSGIGVRGNRGYLYDANAKELNVLDIHSGWPAIGANGILTHVDQTTWFNETENPEIRGNYPMAFNTSGTQLLSVEHFEHLWLYDVETDETRELLTELSNLYMVSADWLPNGSILVSTYSAIGDQGALWEYDEAAQRLTPLYTRENTSLGHAQVIPCDYGL